MSAILQISAKLVLSRRKDAVRFDYAADDVNLAWFIRLSFKNFPQCDIRLN